MGDIRLTHDDTAMMTRLSNLEAAVSALSDAVAAAHARVTDDFEHLRALLVEALAVDSANKAEIDRLRAEADAVSADTAEAIADLANLDPDPDNPVVAETPDPLPEPMPTEPAPAEPAPSTDEGGGDGAPTVGPDVSGGPLPDVATPSEPPVMPDLGEPDTAETDAEPTPEPAAVEVPAVENPAPAATTDLSPEPAPMEPAPDLSDPAVAAVFDAPHVEGEPPADPTHPASPFA